MRTAPQSTRRVLAAIALGLVASLTAVAGGSAAAEAELSGTDGIGAVTRAPLSLGTGPRLSSRSWRAIPSPSFRRIAVPPALPRARRKRSRRELKLIAERPPLRDREARRHACSPTYQLAYNGIKVRIDPRNAAAAGRRRRTCVAVRPLQVMERDNVRGVAADRRTRRGTAPPASTVRASRSPSSTPASTTRTQTSADPAPRPRTTRHTAARHAAADPALFGPDAPQVKGGIDLVGDNYNADRTRPTRPAGAAPGPEPAGLQGHGTHVAGTAAGSGVLG